MKFMEFISKCETTIKEFDERVLIAAEVKFFGEPLDDKLDRLYDKTGQLLTARIKGSKEWYATKKGN